ncbi:MAG TPA: ABC transporter ATP-binding protein [Ruminococcus sp.]|nr:ABC transporter ATP-binding protein [Ruminococcus sp.]
MNDEMILQAKGVRKVYTSSGGQNTEILKGIDLEIRKGEFVAIMGQSGSGKSTLLYCISGMDPVTGGSVLYNGKELQKLDDDEISRVRLLEMGFVFQQSYMLKDFTIKENIMLPALKAGKISKEQAAKEVRSRMEQVGIAHIADSDITQVSGGQLQRAAICRALVNQPAVLFADEPTGALNTKSTGEIMEIFNQVNRDGTTIVMVTHDGKVAARADRVIYLEDGQLRQEYRLGTWNTAAELPERETKLFQWLRQNGF